MKSDYREPLNLGQDRMISINELVDMVAKIAGKRVAKRYDESKPKESVVATATTVSCARCLTGSHNLVGRWSGARL